MGWENAVVEDDYRSGEEIFVTSQRMYQTGGCTDGSWG